MPRCLKQYLTGSDQYLNRECISNGKMLEDTLQLVCSFHLFGNFSLNMAI